MNGRSFRVGSVRLDARSEGEIIETVAAWARDRARSGDAVATRTVCFVNAWSIASASRDEDFRRAINECDLSVVDGVPPAWVGRRLAGTPCDRLSGPDLMHRLLTAPEHSDLTHFVYGGDAEALARLDFRYSAGGTRRPRRIVGTFSPSLGDPRPDEEASFLARLEETRPDILWVCLGTARQEKWMARMKSRLEVPVMAGVGAAIDFLSGGKRRAPRWLQRPGLEWLFRLATEPRRLWRRYLVGNILFARLATAALLRRRERGTDV